MEKILLFYTQILLLCFLFILLFSFWSVLWFHMFLFLTNVFKFGCILYLNQIIDFSKTIKNKSYLIFFKILLNSWLQI